MDKDRIASSAKDFAGKVEGTVGDIAGDAKTQAAGRVREATGTAQNLYGQAKDAAREATDAAVSYAKDAYENGGDTFRDGSQAIAKKVQDNPLGSMLIAGGIGFALALLMTRTPRRPPPRRWRYSG
ncbi:MAG: CsbD family protein [Bradyrhizobium sp.]